MGPSYANVFVGYIEHKFFNKYNRSNPELKRRYIDDCLVGTSSTREELNQFITAVNSFHQALKYTWEISDTSLAFLDIKLSIEHGYPASVVQAGHHRAQQIDRQSALQTSQKENNNRIPFTLTTPQLNPLF